jgi:hypothetical protein
LASISAKLDRLIAALLPAAAKPIEVKKAFVAPTEKLIAKEESKSKKEKKADVRVKVEKKKPAKKKK